MQMKEKFEIRGNFDEAVTLFQGSFPIEKRPSPPSTSFECLQISLLAQETSNDRY